MLINISDSINWLRLLNFHLYCNYKSKTNPSILIFQFPSSIPKLIRAKVNIVHLSTFII